MYVSVKQTADPSVQPYQPTLGLSAGLFRTARRLTISKAIRRYAQSIPEEHTYFSDDRTVFYQDAAKQIPRSDLIQLHWVADFLDYGAFFSWLPKDMPLVWTFHDMANLTGGCCFDLGCGKFVEKCGACPQLGSHDKSDLTRHVWQRKKGYYSTLDPARVHIVAPSHWLADEVGRSPLLSRFSRSVIPYALDLDVFQPRDRGVARELLGIPLDTRVVLFLAHKTKEFRKGHHVLMDALDGITADANIFLLSVGAGDTPKVQRFPHVCFDGIGNDRVLSFIYSAADIFVCPSLADNLPNTILESIACGTPVVAFAAGGIPDLVRPGITGLLARTGDASDLRNAILQLLDDRAKCSEMSANCRRVALEEYELTLQGQRYQRLYEDMLAGTSKPAPAEEPGEMRVEEPS
jgi:glycosyltransferase involved in cell wall biosynthesis